MSGFELFVLQVLEQIPELKITIPDVVKNNLQGIISLADCLVVVNDFLPILCCSIAFSFINLSHSVFKYIKGFSKYR